MAEESLLNRSAIIFLLCKIYFTDDIANQLKLRITADEWIVFNGFMQEIEKLSEYETTRIMFYHLYTENFFKFTMKNKALALDYGNVENANELSSNHIEEFWKDIRKDVEVLEKCELVELKQLNELRDEAMKPFDNIFQEEGLLKTALVEFESLKQAIQEPPVVVVQPKVTRKQITAACRNFLKTSNVGSTMQRIEIEEIEWDSDLELENQPTTSKKQKQKEKSRHSGPNNKKESDSSGSDSDEDYRRMNRSLGFSSQNVMKGIGVNIENFSEKLKKCYEQT